MAMYTRTGPYLVDGRQAKAARAILGMTVDEMAAASGINRNSVMRLEGFKRLPFHSHAGNRIAQVIQDRGVICDMIGQDPIVRFKTTEVPAKYRRKPTTSRAGA